MATAPKLTYPALYQAACLASKTGQNRYMGSIAIRLVALALAALGGAVTLHLGGQLEPFAWAALVAFVIALAIEMLILALKPDQQWYEGRAAAESVKTLTWRYAVAGDPFPVTSSNTNVDKALLSRLRDITHDLRSISLPAAPEIKDQITTSMRTLRECSFDERRKAYITGRLDDQFEWYGERSRQNASRNMWFLLVATAFEFVGVVGATLRLARVIEFDLLGVLAAVVAGVVSWAQTRQYGSLSRAYSIAAQELATIRTEAFSVNDLGWSRFVDDAEQAISREHTLWRASRGLSTKGGR